MRVPALSVGAGEGNSLAYQRRLQVPKLNEIQVTDGKQEPTHKWNRYVKRSFKRACNKAARHGQAQPLYLCTFRFLQIPEECLAADHRGFALSRMLTECWRRQPTPSLDGMARTGPQPHVCFEMWFGCTSFQLTASMCKNVFWRCSAARPPLGTERQQSQYTRFSVCPPPQFAGLHLCRAKNVLALDFNQILHSIDCVNGCTVGLPGDHHFG